MITRWNIDKKHRCPECHTIAVGGPPSSWEVYTCCNCGAQFARWPRLQRLLHHVGVTCDECTTQQRVRVDGTPYGYVRRRAFGFGDQILVFEARAKRPVRLPEEPPAYLGAFRSRADAFASIGQDHRVFVQDAEDDPTPMIAVVPHDSFDKYAEDLPESVREGFRSESLEVYGVGLLSPHPVRRRFSADADTFIGGVIASAEAEGVYSSSSRITDPVVRRAAQAL